MICLIGIGLAFLAGVGVGAVVLWLLIDTVTNEDPNP